MEQKNLRGLRALAFTRRSTFHQSETSNEQQEQILRDYAIRHGMILVDVYHSRGVSGSRTENRADIDDLLALAEQGKFDRLLIQSYDRLTRGGGRYGPY